MSLPGDDHVPFVGDGDALLDEVEEFVTGSRPAPAVTTLLATVVFTDIVGSTERQAALGDRGWKDLVERHHAVVRDAQSWWRGPVEAPAAGAVDAAAPLLRAREARGVGVIAVAATDPHGVPAAVGLVRGEDPDAAIVLPVAELPRA